MKTKNIRLRMDPKDGEIWLVEEKPYQPIRRLKKMTDDVILSLAADVTAVDRTKKTERDIKFSDGHRIKLTIEHLDPEETGPPARI